ncbi:MAG: hypothetical protein R3301_13885 [Saprospiraceae bacterium]|nr:hypothetical protein [Saprospiraceae bacterium]
MQIRIKVINSNKNWTSFRYMSSNATSRMSTPMLHKKFQKGEVHIVNPKAFELYEEEAAQPAAT